LVSGGSTITGYILCINYKGDEECSACCSYSQQYEKACLPIQKLLVVIKSKTAIVFAKEPGEKTGQSFEEIKIHREEGGFWYQCIKQIDETRSNNLIVEWIAKGQESHTGFIVNIEEEIQINSRSICAKTKTRNGFSGGFSQRIEYASISLFTILESSLTFDKIRERHSYCRCTSHRPATTTFTWP
jgi:hypothetical protein